MIYVQKLLNPLGNSSTKVMDDILMNWLKNDLSHSLFADTTKISLSCASKSLIVPSKMSSSPMFWCHQNPTIKTFLPSIWSWLLIFMKIRQLKIGRPEYSRPKGIFNRIYTCYYESCFKITVIDVLFIVTVVCCGSSPTWRLPIMFLTLGSLTNACIWSGVRLISVAHSWAVNV